jgi:hypothetical protein
MYVRMYVCMFDECVSITIVITCILVFICAYGGAYTCVNMLCFCIIYICMYVYTHRHRRHDCDNFSQVCDIFIWVCVYAYMHKYIPWIHTIHTYINHLCTCYVCMHMKVWCVAIIHTHIHTYINTWPNDLFSISVCLYISMCDVSVCMYVCMHVCMHIYIYIYIYIYEPSLIIRIFINQ